MIATELIIARNGARMIRTYSTDGLRLRQDQTGVTYDEAIDIENSGYTYTETEERAEGEELEPQEALDIIFGGDPE